ncbi:MAG: HAMP domain-containing sensor histidine kinase [Polyangiaceae bacterium]
MSEPVRFEGVQRRFSLRIRVVAAILFAALAPLGVVFLWSQLDRNVPGRMWSETRAAAGEIRQAVRSGADDVALERLARQERVRLRVLDARGEIVFDEDADDPADRFGALEERLLGASTTTLRELDETMGRVGDRVTVRTARLRGEGVVCDTLPLLYCEAAAMIDGDKVVHVQRSSRRAVQAVYALRAQLLRLAVVTVPLALMIAIYTGRRVVRPVEHLRRQALERAAAATRTPALAPEHRDEIGELGDAFNTLLAALDQKRAENEAFVADLVHELKNPVAAVRATAEALERGAVDAERAARLARVLGDSSAKLDRLVTQFLELARADAGMPNEERSRVALADLVRGITARMQEDPRYGDVTFVADVDGDPSVIGVAHRLDAVVRELLENGASFAGAGGRVEVTLRAEPKTRMAWLRVHDTGPGIAEADLPQVFARFFTTRGARRGTGLGLALVHSVCRAHGGDVSVSSSEGATFTVQLPLAG